MWKQRKEKIKLEKIEKMKSELRKQGLIVDNAKTVEVDAIDQNPIEPRIKYYGMDTLPAVSMENGMESLCDLIRTYFYDSCLFYFIFLATVYEHRGF